MRILLSNDDGYFAPGLAALAEALREVGDVVVVAPEQNRSGASNSLHQATISLEEDRDGIGNTFHVLFPASPPAGAPAAP